MSLDATIWAWRAEVDSSTQRLILLSLADRAGEDHKCYPSIMRMVKDTKMNRKTIIKVLDDLEKKALIKYTGKIVGNGVKVYQLLGVVGREDHPTSTKKGTSGKNGTSSNLGTGSNIGTSTENGTSTSPENGTETSTEIGTQNLPRNLPIESKNKKDWLCSKKLREEITLADDSIEPETLMTAKWVEREKRAFEIYNQDKSICDELLNFYFADWLLHAYRTKYSQETKTGYGKTPAAEPKQLTDKQISVFAQKLAHHPEFASKQSAPGDSYEQLASRIAIKLMNPAQAKKWEPYLKQVGFTGSLQGAA
ncbi:helix-turn-helix domain-containing protein [Acinetobacter johnsonii]|uniref:helix-turn-helix domain-containing protein n=1 Tax=Acinetobacter johnsonii TaxID=40214 RepID=UPI0030B3E662